MQKIPVGSKSYKGTIWRQIRISRSGGRQKICQIVSLSIRRVWGKGEKWKLKSKIENLLSPNPVGRPDTQAIKSMKWTSEETLFVQKELRGLDCRWNVYHQNLDRIDEMKQYKGPGFENLSLLLLFARIIGFCQNFWQITQRLPGNWIGVGKRFSWFSRAGAPSPLACLPRASRFFFRPLLASARCRLKMAVNGSTNTTCQFKNWT